MRVVGRLDQSKCETGGEHGRALGRSGLPSGQETRGGCGEENRVEVLDGAGVTGLRFLGPGGALAGSSRAPLKIGSAPGETRWSMWRARPRAGRFGFLLVGLDQSQVDVRSPDLDGQAGNRH